jgi:hypothetical protein
MSDAPLHVFICHSSEDKPAVEQLAAALRARGIDAWLDKWEIGPGDDIIASINRGLEEAQAGIICFSQHTAQSRWVESEVSALIHARITESKRLIPVKVSEDTYIPPLLRPLAWRSIEEVEAIADGLLHRGAGKPDLRTPETGRAIPVRITLHDRGAQGLQVEVEIEGRNVGAASLSALPRRLSQAQARFQQSMRHATLRSPEMAERTGREADLAELGRALRDLCLPGEAGAELLHTLNAAPVGSTVDVIYEADSPALLALPYEALRLPDDRLLATHEMVSVMRRPAGLDPPAPAPLAGPFKILVAVAAPDEEVSGSAVLDQERELQNILDAVEPAQRSENCQVRILEVGSPAAIGAALRADAYHLLHISCHGLPGGLELEDEDGKALRVNAETLLGPLREAGRPLPMVLLSSCHGVARTARRPAWPRACCVPAFPPCWRCRPPSATTTPRDWPGRSITSWRSGSICCRAAPWPPRAGSWSRSA